MGLYTLPAPSEGVLILLLVNTAVLSISLLKDVVRSLLLVVGLHHRAASPADDAPGDESFADRFRSRVKPVLFGVSHAAADCRVCLARFDPESVVNRLPCGHLFHRACLERWLDYRHVTCPLCRACLFPADELSSSSLA